MGDFRKLRVWQHACRFADEVEAMVMTLPYQQRRYALDQLVPAAHAIHENIAEGCGFDSDRQLLKYARQALSTANESEDELLALDRKNLLGQSVSLLGEVRSVCAQLAKLIRKLEIDVARVGHSRRPAGRRPLNPGSGRARRRTAIDGDGEPAAGDLKPKKPDAETDCRLPAP